MKNNGHLQNWGFKNRKLGRTPEFGRHGCVQNKRTFRLYVDRYTGILGILLSSVVNHIFNTFKITSRISKFLFFKLQHFFTKKNIFEEQFLIFTLQNLNLERQYLRKIIQKRIALLLIG